VLVVVQCRKDPLNIQQLGPLAVAADPITGAWTAIWKTIPQGFGCGCGDDVVVDAYCAAASSCRGSLATTIQCACWTTSISWTWSDAKGNPVASPMCVDGATYVQFIVNTIPPSPPSVCSPLTILLDYGDITPAPSCAAPGGAFITVAPCGSASTYDGSSSPPLLPHAYSASGALGGATYKPRLIICNAPPGCPTEVLANPITVPDCPACPTLNGQLYFEASCDDGSSSGSVTAYIVPSPPGAPSWPTGTSVSWSVTDYSTGRSIAFAPGPAGTLSSGIPYAGRATCNGLKAGVNVQFGAALSPPVGSGCTNSGTVPAATQNIATCAPPTTGRGVSPCALFFSFIIAISLGVALAAAEVTYVLTYCLHLPIPAWLWWIVAIAAAAALFLFGLWALLCAFGICQCPTRCDIEMIAWMTLLTGAIVAVYLLPCCSDGPLSGLTAIASGDTLLAGGLLAVWIAKCHVSPCQILAAFGIAVGSSASSAYAYLNLIAAVKACGIGWLPAVTAAIGGVLTVAGIACYASAKSGEHAPK